MYVNREKGQEKFESFQLLEDEMVRRKGIFDINQGLAVAAFCDGPTQKNTWFGGDQQLFFWPEGNLSFEWE